MKASRHNGRSGKNGSYNPKHNDRNFDPEHSEHIDQVKMLQNVYWDWINGRRTQAESMKKEYPSFEEVEQDFYDVNFWEFVNGQNARNESNGHSERNRSFLDLYQDKKKCPEESIYQLGNIDSSVSPGVLLEVTEEFLKRFNDAYGSNITVIDWALHVDEATPHIHERHVFYAFNKYGELAPQQDKALEELGFELPNPDKPKSRTNNRKMVFDAEVRNMFLDVCEEYGISVEREATYGGRAYMEKQDFIIANQKARLKKTSKELAEKQEKLSVIETDIAAVNTVMECLAETAYDTACDIVIEPTVKAVTRDFGSFAKKGEENDSFDYGKAFNRFEKEAVHQVLKRVMDKINETVSKWIKYFKEWFKEPEQRDLYVEKVKQVMWDKLENLAKSGPEDEEIHEAETEEKKEEVAEKVQEVAAEMVRRRGRAR